MSKYVRTTASRIKLSLSIPKFVFFLLYLYLNWYKEIWGDLPIMLYGSVIALTLSLFLPISDEKYRFFNFQDLTGFFIVLFIYGVYSFISGILVCIDRTNFVSSMVTYFSYLVVLFDCCLISKRDGSWNWLLTIMIIVAFICCFQVILWGKPMRNAGATVITMSAINNPNSASLVMLFGIYGLVVNSEQRMKYLWLRIPVVLMLFYAIMLTGSRKVLIATSMLLILWLFGILRNLQTNPNTSESLRTVFFILLAVIAVIIFIRRYYVNTEQFERLMRLSDDFENPENSSRIGLYQTAFEVWKQHPILGVGFDQYKLYTEYGSYSHSTYAEVLSCTGLIGGAILFSPVLKYTVNILKCAFQANNEYHNFFFMCFAGVLIQLFLGVGQIWTFGLSHELFLICVFGMFEYSYRAIDETGIQREGKIRCNYIK